MSHPSPVAPSAHPWRRAARAWPLLAALLAPGCTFNHTMNLTPKLDRLEVPAPVATPVSLYYSPELKAATYARLLGPHRYIYAIGKDSLAMLDAVAGKAFTAVTRLEALPPFGAAPAAGLIIEPELEGFHFQLGIEGDEPDHAIRYRLHFYAPDGTPRGSRLVVGKEVPPRSHFTVFERVDDNMDDAAVKVLKEFLALGALPPAPEVDAGAAAGTPELLVSAAPVPGHLWIAPNLAASLAGAGVLAVSLSVRNQGARRLTVGAADARLVLEGGRTIGTSDPAAVPTRLEERRYGGDVAAGLAGAPVGVLVMLSQADEARERRAVLLGLLRRDGFGERTLAPGEAAQGTLFFIPADGTRPFDAARLSLWAVEEGGRRAFRTEAAVSGLGYGAPRPPPPRPAQPQADRE